MPDSKSSGFVAELKRRRVFQAAAIYAGVAWATIEIITWLIGRLGLSTTPDIIEQYMAVLFVAGFPVAVYLAWSRDLGLKARRVVAASTIALLTIAIVVWVTARRPVEIDPPPPNTVMVMPFANAGDDPNEAYFAAALPGQILTALASIDAIREAGQSSIEYFAAPDHIVQRDEIRSKLRVANVLDGRVRKDGNQIHVELSLTDTLTGDSVWSGQFDGHLGDVFGFQAQVADGVAHALKVEISGDERQILDRKPTENVEAYNYYLLARRADDLDRAISLFKRAIELDPEFTDAWLWLAFVHLANLGPNFADIHLVLDVTEQALNEVEKYMDNPAETSDIFNYVKALYLRRQMFAGKDVTADDRRLLETSFKKAIELNPSRPQTYLSLAIYYRNAGMIREAEDQLRAALDRDPLYGAGMYQLSRILSKQGKFDESLGLVKRVPELLGWGHRMVATRYRELSQFDQALRWSRMAPQGRNQTLDQQMDLHLALRAAGDEPGWQELISRSLDDNADDISDQRFEAWLMGVNGDFEAGYELAAAAIDKLGSAAWYDLNEPAMLALYAEQYEDVVRYYELAFQNLRDPLRPQITGLNTMPALELAYALYQLGDTARADVLFGRLLDLVEDELRLGYDGRRHTISKIVDVCVFATRGETDKALAAMREAVDQGWRGLYDTWTGNIPPMLASLEGNPEFDAMVAQINADLVVQRERIAQANGPSQTAAP